MSALLQELVDESSLAYPATRFGLDLAPSIHAEVDEVRFAQVVVNLIGNARQHGLIGEAIKLRLFSADGMVHVEVRNAAPPLAAALIPGLFEPLKRGSTPSQRNPHGLGLGLYIASEAIKGHRGTLSYSYEGEHVTFTITVPARQAAS